MLARRHALRALGLVLITSAGLAAVGDRAKLLRFPHASLEAYPDAVISTKDFETGMAFYVESDGRKLVALDRDGAVAWGVDVFAGVDSGRILGKPVIRHLRIEGKRVWATCGKHDVVGIDIGSGEVAVRAAG